MYDNGAQVYDLFVRKFPQKMATGEYRYLVFDMMDSSLTDAERHAARDALGRVLGIDPLFEVSWERSILENPSLDNADVRDKNRRLLFDAYFNQRADTEERVEKREEWEQALGRDPLVESGPMYDWDS